MQKSIEGYEGIYEITDDGKVWSVRNQIYLIPTYSSDLRLATLLDMM